MNSNSVTVQNNFQNVKAASSDAGARSLIAFVSGFVVFVLASFYGYGYSTLLGGAVAVLVFLSIVINQEYERAVVFRLGAFSRVFGAGLNFKIPFLEWVQKVDYRVKTVNVNPQKVLTKDNVTVTVDAIVFYKVRRDSEAIKNSILEVEDFNKVTVNYGQTMLRAMIGKKELDEILQNRDKIADELRKELDQATNDFGVHIRDVEIQDVSIPQSMERAMAAEAEAERDRRARVTHAEGELQAAARTRLASDILGDGGYKLRTLQTLDEVATENSTVVTIPAELMPGKTSEEETGNVQGIIDQLRESIDMEELIGGAEDAIKDKEDSN
ncbi:MAG: SPFH domain-containing protein [Candidatus Nanohaloarchaea archaeon]|nr:SPFH domain-containing protein [Candidatus Nanohaloarchaea archaeon]